MHKMIPLSAPNLKGNELKYVEDAIKNEWVAGGSYIDRFEEEIAHYLKVNQAVACQSGTAGLHISLRLAGVKSNDEVIVPTLTFIAAVNPVRYLEAEPIFMDCDDSLNMDLDKLEEFLHSECMMTEDGLANKKSKRIIKAIMIVHVFGNMTDMEKLMAIAEKYRLKVVEDATEAIGSHYISGKYKGKFAGTMGDFGVYSFNGNKIMTTGGGGMIVAKDDKMLQKAKYLSTQAKDDKLYYVHDEVGYNYRMNNIQAAMGLAQLEQLEGFIETKKKNYDLYKEEIEKIHGLKLLEFNSHIRPNYWFYSLLIDRKDYGRDRDSLIKKLFDDNIQTRPIWGLIHQQKPYKESTSYKISKADYYIENVLNIPCSTNITREEISIVIDALKSFSAR